jgi:hypothetical protein
MRACMCIVCVRHIKYEHFFLRKQKNLLKSALAQEMLKESFEEFLEFHLNS